MDAIYRSIASLVMGFMSAMGIQAAPATWQLQLMPDGKTVALTISDHPHSTHGTSVAIDQFDGLKPLLSASGPSTGSGQAKFRLKRDAGTFEFDGVLRGGAGGGTLEFVPSDTFAAELAKRGFDKPARGDQYKMAWHDTGFAVIDELAALKYQRPTLQQLISAGDHGVDRAYLRELSAQGYRLGTMDALVRLRDHGVGGDYIRDLASLGLKSVSADDLVRARDHGVDPEYVRAMRSQGYTLTMDELVTARDHGVGPEYVRELGALGYQRISLTDLVRLRDHGVSPGWVRNVRDRNSAKLSLDQLVTLRDHGVDTLEALRRQTHAS